MLTSKLLWVALMVAILFCHQSDAWGRRRRRRCATNSCTWTWSSCSKTCGGGTQYPIKTGNEGACGSCNMPSGTRPCNTQCCRVDCSWNTWGSWTSCSVSCGGGTQTRIRASYGPSCGGTACPGPREETRQCNAQCCPVDCAWSSWELDGSCSATCGGGVQKRNRSYDVLPSCGGAACGGSSTDNVPCNTHCCPQNCIWDSWGNWSACDKSCGGGMQTHTRVVATPASCGGQECQGPSSEAQQCNTQCCVIDCVWGNWTTWSGCTKTCDTGEESRQRKVARMASCGGQDCTGELCETKPCNEFCCPNQCEYTDWSEWTTCDKTCGTGLQSRQREYTATCSAQVCLEPVNEERTCNTNCCPVDCVLSDWTPWSECSATCGTKGMQQRARTVLQEMECGGTPCDPELNQNQTCNHICFQSESIVTSSGCICADGWKGECCELDVNECDYVDCPEHSDCFNSEGSYECVCHQNYTKEGDVCLHFDKCADGRHDCAAQAECVMQNMQDYVCTCNPGYEGNGFNCSDVDECTVEIEPSGESGEHENYSGEQVITEWSPICSREGKCINTEGSYTCECNKGFEGDGWNCTDFDECAVHNAKYGSVNSFETAEDGVDYCNQYANCTNTYGSYYCTCKEGYFGDGKNCTEINECDSDPCKNGGNCINEVAQFSCQCAEGYAGEVCLDDLNECELHTADCNNVNGTCINIQGSFVCECNPGFEGDGRTCIDIDECALGTDDCSGKFPLCRNVPGHYVCDCEPGSQLVDGGYVPPGKNQTDGEVQENEEIEESVPPAAGDQQPGDEEQENAEFEESAPPGAKEQQETETPIIDIRY